MYIYILSFAGVATLLEVLVNWHSVFPSGSELTSADTSTSHEESEGPGPEVLAALRVQLLWLEQMACLGDVGWGKEGS